MEDGEPLLEADLNEDEVYLWEAIIRREPLGVVRSIVESLPELVRVRNDDDADESDDDEDDDNDRRVFFPLHDAVEFGSSLEIVEYLYGCCPAAIGVRGKPAAAYRAYSVASRGLPLHFVMPATPPECVAFLVDQTPKALALRNERGELPLHAAIKSGASRPAIQILFERMPRAIAERDSQGFLPIHAAAAVPGPHQLDVMRYLIELSPQSVRERTTPAWGDPRTQGRLPLHLFLQTERLAPDPWRHGDDDDDADDDDAATDPEVLRLLLEQWPESVRERAESALPLHFALFSPTPSVEVVRILLHADLEALREKDLDGSTVLHKAVRNGFLPHDLLRLLVDAGHDLLLEADEAGDLPIHVAMREGLPTSESTIELLAEACPQSLQVANLQGQSPVHIAIAHDNLGAVQTLADLNPEVLEDVDAQFNTPAHLVASCDYASADLARYVVEAWPESLLETNVHGDTPIHVAIDRAYPSSDVLDVFLEECPESLRVANMYGVYPLSVAIARNHLPIVNRIVEQVPNSAQQVDRQGNLPLVLAAENESMDLNLLFLLLKAWPDVVLGTQLSSFKVGGGGNDPRSLKRRRSPSMA